MKESKALRILNLEDSVRDAEFVQASLIEGNICCELIHVQTRADFTDALENGAFDIILADYAVASFSGLSALNMARKIRPEVPFIFIVDTIGVDLAIEIINKGATDYVLRHRLGRLVPAIHRAIREVAERNERKQIEQTLRLSEERFRLLAEEVVEGIAVNYEGRIVDANRRFAEMFGYGLEEIVGMEAIKLAPPEFREMVATRISSENTEAYDAWGLRKDRTVFPIEVRPRYVPYHGRRVRASSVTDLTERKRAEEALRRSEALYRAVVEQVAENIFLIDLDTMHFVEANDAFHRSLGYTSEELGRLTLYDIVAHDRESVDRNTRRVIDRGRYYLGERQYRRKDSSIVNVEVNASLVHHDSKMTMCFVAHDITERKRTEETLHRSLSVLLALREANQILGSTLESEEIVSRLLEIMQRVLNLTATVISMHDENGNLQVWRSVGIEGLWARARYAPEAEIARRMALDQEEQQFFRLSHPEIENESLSGLCLPIRTRDRTFGVLEAYGPVSLTESETTDILDSLTSQAASALQNAQLYAELETRQHRLHDLVGKLLVAQEEERSRVAYEVHDGLAQVAAAAHQHLQAFARRYSPDAQKGREDLDRILRLVRGTVSDARRIIANLRPTTLDDLGLVATVALEVERLREDGYQVDYEETLGEARLPDTIEIALFRIVQESLTNMRKHAQARRVRVKLSRGWDEVHLEIRDDGCGFDPTAASASSGPGERVGLAGMQERVSLLDGRIDINSQLGVGTSIEATIPLTQVS